MTTLAQIDSKLPARTKAPSLNVKRWDTVPVKINKLHALAQQAAATAIEYAVAAGKLLIEEKKYVGHGGWLSWLQENVDFSERTARNYMRVARAFPKLENEKRQHVADLSLRNVLSTLATDSNRLSKQPPASIKKWKPLADTSPARTLKMPVWRIELRDRVLEIVRETMTQTPELTIANVVEALNDAHFELEIEAVNDAFCKLQDGDDE